MQKDFFLLLDAVAESIEQLDKMVKGARRYFQTYNEKHRVAVKDVIRELRRQEHIADGIEDKIKAKAFNMGLDAVSVYHMVRLTEIVGTIADHAENAGDMMRAMLAK